MINLPHLKPLTIRELRDLNLKESVYKIIYINNYYEIVNIYGHLKLIKSLKFYQKKHAKLTLQKINLMGLNKKNVQLKLDI